MKLTSGIPKLSLKNERKRFQFVTSNARVT